MTEKKKNSFVNELKRRNVFRVAIAYLAVSWLLIQVAETIFPLFDLPDSATRTIVIVASLLLIPTLVISWFFEFTASGFIRDSEVDHDAVGATQVGRRFDYAIIGVLSVALIYFVGTHNWSEQSTTDTIDIPHRSVAVLPFVNISGNPDNEYFSDGLTETLLHALAQLSGLKVSARTSSFFFKGKDVDIREIAEKLGVKHVLEGSVQRDGDRVRIVAQLIEADTGFHLWSQTYDRDLTDIFAAQDDIAMSVARAMKVTLADFDAQGGEKILAIGTQNFAAYEHYLKGLQQNNLFSNTSLLQAELSFQTALALDPDFFEARLELAKTYYAQGGFGMIPNTDAFVHVKSLLDRLRADRPDDLDVLVLDARVRHNFNAIDVEELLARLKTEVEKMPSQAPYADIARLLNYTSRHEEAFEWRGRGLLVDPFDWRLHLGRADYMLQIGDLDGAEAAYARALEIEPGNPTLLASAAGVAWRRKNFTQWFAMIKRGMEADPLDFDFWPGIALRLFSCGLLDEGDKYLQHAIEVAPDKAYTRAAQLFRLVLLDDRSGARDMSETMLRDNIANRFGAYRFAALVFVSTMTEMDRTTEALAILEELLPGVTSPTFVFADFKEAALQFYAALASARSPANEEILSALNDFVAGAEAAYPFSLGLPDMKAQVAIVNGNMELAVELALEDLDGRIYMLEAWDWSVRYQHLYYYSALAAEPEVAERLSELAADAKQAGEEIWNFIERNNLQL